MRLTAGTSSWVVPNSPTCTSRTSRPEELDSWKGYRLTLLELAAPSPHQPGFFPFFARASPRLPSKWRFHIIYNRNYLIIREGTISWLSSKFDVSKGKNNQVYLRVVIRSSFDLLKCYGIRKNKTWKIQHYNQKFFTIVCIASSIQNVVGVGYEIMSHHSMQHTGHLSL